MKISDIEINIESHLNSLCYYIEIALKNNQAKNIEELKNQFFEHYQNLLKAHDSEDITDLARFYRLISEFKTALAIIIKPGSQFDQMCDLAKNNFNIVLDRIRAQVNENRLIKTKRRGPIVPSTGNSIILNYFCSKCKQVFDIPLDIQHKLLNSEEKQELPKHCDTEMGVKIAKPKEVVPDDKEENPTKKIEIYPAELLMGHIDSKESNAEYLKILSVGIDIGSSTSHLIFSRLTLKRETSFFNLTNRFLLINREIIYESKIIFTPLLDQFTIDIEAIVKFCQEEYKKANITPEMVDTGAVIVTGETAKKQNAEEIVNRLASKSGKFVSATAGPNFESQLGIMGSGIVKISAELQKTILNSDIGGGSSNMAIASNGEVISCSCINIGGRLLGIDEKFKIWRIDGPSEFLMKELNMTYKIGDVISETDVHTLAHEYAKAQLEVMQGCAKTKIAKHLMMTVDLDFSTPIDAYSFSGGIGEFIYQEDQKMTFFNDIGHFLAQEIKNLAKTQGLSIIEPENKIRATVIGAGAFSLTVSGSTCFVDKNVKLPLNNIPVIPVNISQDNLSPEKVKEEIDNAFHKYDMKEGEDIAALYFNNPIYGRDELLQIFAKSLEKALPNSVTNQKTIILLFKSDLAKLLGIALHKHTFIQSNLICLDELTLEAGDWIDIGPSLYEPPRQAFPVTIKSLVFNHTKINKN